MKLPGAAQRTICPAAERQRPLGLFNPAAYHFGDIQRTGEGWFHAEVHRKRGELFLKQTPPNVSAAELAFAKALEIARSQLTRTFELRAALSLAGLYRATGRTQAARALLIPALVGFKERIEVPEAREARGLLAQGDTYKN